MSPSKPVRVAFIASASHSGSTILGMVLGSDPRAVFAGEVKQYRRLHELSRQRNERGRCGCGAWYEDCHFWNGVWHRCPPAMDLHASPGFSWRNLGLVLRLFLPGAGSPDRRADGDHTEGDAYAEAIAAIRDEAAERDPRIDLVVDSSKSLRSVDMLAQSANVELFVIHLIRDGALVAASYKRRGKGALNGMAAWLYSALLTNRFATRNDVRSLVLDYDRLCVSTGEELDRLNAFFGTSLSPDRVAERVRGTEYHVLAGNRVSRGAARFDGLVSTSSASELNLAQRMAAWMLLRPIYRALTGRPESR